MIVGRIVLILILAWLAVFAYLRNFQSRGIYYPEKEILFTPAVSGFEFENIFFDTDDGLRLNGWFIPARQARGTLVFCHGNAGNIGHRLEIIEIFNKLGLSVFIFDWRGYGRSQGRPSEQGLYKDAEAAYRYVIGRSEIQKNSIVIYGRSLGANVAIDLASKVSVSCAIFESGFTSAYDMGRRLFPYLPVKWMISIKYNALDKIRSISAPKLIIHSIDDEIVPFELGRRLFESAAAPKEFYKMRGGHNDAMFISGAEYSLTIKAFLDKYLPQP